MSSGARTHLRLLSARKDRAWKEFAVLMLVKPRAFKVEQRNAGEMRKRQRVDRELRERLVGGRIGLVVEYVNGAVADLNEIDVAGNRTLLAVQFETSVIPHRDSIAAISCSLSHIGISTATVTESFANMKR